MDRMQQDEDHSAPSQVTSRAQSPVETELHGAEVPQREERRRGDRLARLSPAAREYMEAFYERQRDQRAKREAEDGEGSHTRIYLSWHQ